MRFFLILIALVFVSLFLFVGFDGWRGRSIAKRASVIRIGDGKRDVERTLGKPSSTFSLSFFTAWETWGYGSTIDWQHLFTSPIKFRVVIEYDVGGKVSRVKIPQPNE